jgi:hypothetical protein
MNSLRGIEDRGLVAIPSLVAATRSPPLPRDTTDPFFSDCGFLVKSLSPPPTVRMWRPRWSRLPALATMVTEEDARGGVSAAPEVGMQRVG